MVGERSEAELGEEGKLTVRGWFPSSPFYDVAKPHHFSLSSNLLQFLIDDERAPVLRRGSSVGTKFRYRGSPAREPGCAFVPLFSERTSE